MTATFAQITDTITVAAGPATYLNSRVAMDARHAWAQAQRAGSTWQFRVVANGEAVVGAGFATHGEAIAAMYAATPALFTTVASITAGAITWDVTTATPARPGYGKGSDGVVIGVAQVTLTEEPEAADEATTAHTTIVQREGSIGGFAAFRAFCNVCGPIGPRYVADHAAQGVADDHAARPFKRHQVDYRRTERGTMQPVPGTVVWSTTDPSRAIDLTREELTADYDTVSYVITGVKAVL